MSTTAEITCDFCGETKNTWRHATSHPVARKNVETHEFTSNVIEFPTLTDNEEEPNEANPPKYTIRFSWEDWAIIAGGVLFVVIVVAIQHGVRF